MDQVQPWIRVAELLIGKLALPGQIVVRQQILERALQPSIRGGDRQADQSAGQGSWDRYFQS